MRLLLVGLGGLLALSLASCSDDTAPSAVAGAPASHVSGSPGAGADDPSGTTTAPPSLDVPPGSGPKDQTLPSGLTQPGARLKLGQPARVLLGVLDPKTPPVVDYIVNRVVPAPDADGRAVFRIRITRTAITDFSNALSFSSFLFDAVNEKGRVSEPVFGSECKTTLVDSMTRGQREDFCVAVSLPRGSKVAAVRYRAGSKSEKGPASLITWRP